MAPKKKFTTIDFAPGRTFNPNASAFAPGTSGIASAVNSAVSSTANSTTASPAGSSLNLQALLESLKSTIPSSNLLAQFEAVAQAGSAAELKEATTALVAQIETPEQIKRDQVSEGLNTLLKLKKATLAREGALQIVSLAAAKFEVFDGQEQSYLAAAYLVPLLPLALKAHMDKEGSVKRAAQDAVRALQRASKPEVLCSRFVSYVWDVLADNSNKAPTKIAALECIDFLSDNCAPDWVELQFYRGLPILMNQLHDFKPEVAKQAQRTTTKFMQKLDNGDVVPRIDVIIDALTDPKKIQNCIKTLSAVTFVAEVTEPCLSVLVPILKRALTVFSSQDSLRQSVVVTENLTRLVHNPFEVYHFIPDLMPGIKHTLEHAAQPEVRELASRAYSVLESAEKETQTTERALRITFEQAEQDVTGFANAKDLPEEVRALAVDLVLLTVNTREFTILKQVYDTLIRADDSDAKAHVLHFEQMFADSRVDDEEIDGVEIVNAKFSLAYGGRMLLNKATMRLIKGHRYGLVGRNGCGKSTLMRSIALEKLEGFPDRTQLRTCFVEHRLQGSDANMDLVSFIASDPELSDVPRSEISDALANVGFDEERRAQSVGSLSGGWKMKLELARAMLMKADVLLLDEPTNHLDVGNVKWLQDYLVEHTDITSLIVSHDSGFLDEVCTDIIHYESKRLVYYKGNLSEFVKVRPEGKAYYTLTDSVVQMAFPAPGILTGVRSNTRAIARMSDVSFKYPGSEKYSLQHVSCSVSLSSRVAVLGPNGAGKSTMIKLLTGELVPTSGTVEKHPNLRIGYIAQHALQYVEQHKEKTANQYLQWRYQNGDDREIHLKQTRKVSDEELAVMEKPQKVDDGRERLFEAIIGRQKLKKTFQYEIKWKGMLPKHNTWLAREDLIERGFGKLVQEFDDHEASREGLGYRELVPPVIRKHFEDVGLDGDIADHTPLGSLSGGQLVKVVIAGATWNNPHMLVLDEPTNYLDRDSLGGLAVAIRDWSGAVILISHNTEFVGALSAEQWIVENGTMVVKGKVEGNASSFDDAGGASAESTPAVSEASSTVASRVASPAPAANNDDSPANIKIRKKKKKLTRNEQKEREARRRLRYIDWLNSPKGTPKPEDTDDEA